MGGDMSHIEIMMPDGAGVPVAYRLNLRAAKESRE